MAWIRAIFGDFADGWVDSDVTRLPRPRSDAGGWPDDVTRLPGGRFPLPGSTIREPKRPSPPAPPSTIDDGGASSVNTVGNPIPWPPPVDVHPVVPPTYPVVPPTFPVVGGSSKARKPLSAARSAGWLFATKAPRRGLSRRGTPRRRR